MLATPATNSEVPSVQVDQDSKYNDGDEGKVSHQISSVKIDDLKVKTIESPEDHEMGCENRKRSDHSGGYTRDILT